MKFRFRLLFSLLYALCSTLFALNVHSLDIAARHSHTTTLLPDGNILVTGGITGPGNTSLSTVEIYFTSSSSWGSGASMTPARSSHTATLLSDGRVLVAGGFTNGTPAITAQVYNPIANSWTTVTGNMTVARGGHTATLLNKGTNKGKVFICGGQTGGAISITMSCEVCDASDCSDTGVAVMTSSRTEHTASLLSSGRVFVSAGKAWNGTNFVYLPTNEIYEPESNIWFPAEPLLEARTNHTATTMNNGNVLIAGGYNGLEKKGNQGILESAEMFNPNGGRVPISGTAYMVMPIRMQDHSATLVPDGSLAILGGFGNITTTYHESAPKFKKGSKITVDIVDITTGSLNVNSTIQFEIDATLSRAVSGRIVNGDAFFSKPSDSENSTIIVDNVDIYLEISTATLDGKLIENKKPGKLKTTLSLTPPNGRIVFEPQTLSADDTTLNSVSQVTFSPALASGKTDSLDGGTLIIPLSIEVSKIFIGGVMTGSATITGGTITEGENMYSISLSGGDGQFFNASVTENTEGNGVINPTITFTGLEGTITNSTNTSISSPLDVSDQSLTSVSLYLEYVATKVNIEDQIFTFDVATITIRHMIFSHKLKYSPSDSAWSFDEYFDVPVFAHNTILTPAADAVVTGGKNCEDDTSVCQRNNLNASTAYNSNQTDIVFIYQNTSKWTEGPTLKTKRGNHTSTLLADGTILACGGTDGNQTLSSCELYNPLAQSQGGPGSMSGWEPTGPMNYSRSNHKAILLPNGNVLAIGGTVNSSTPSTNTCEIYYPRTRRWVLTDSMQGERANHSAMLLPDGNVIVMGGSTGNGYLNTAEVYITTNAEWQPISGTMGAGRMNHTATFLKNGKILVAGGLNGAGALDSVEIYDPVARTFSAAPDVLILPRYFHTATLLKDGRVLVVGGSDGYGALDTAEIFDGSTWEFTSDIGSNGNDLTTIRANHTTVLLPNGKILVTGGESPGKALDTVEGYDVDFSTWQSQGTMEKRARHTTVLMPDNYLMNIGGWDGTGYLNSTEKIYFSFADDSSGFKSTTEGGEMGGGEMGGEVSDIISRRPEISSATAYFDRGETVTLLSGTSNFHGASEASGGGAGPRNSSFHNPRIYIQAVDNPSGFLVDLTTRIYSVYGGINTDWEQTLSSITLTMPAYAGELPHGWYYFRAANNGQFSQGYLVQVTTPRPTGTITQLTGAVISTTTIRWNWCGGTSCGGTLSGADGYMVLSASNNVFITTITLTEWATFYQSNLSPNTRSSIKVGGYNIGGSGEFVASATYYTQANPPSDLQITSASFETASLKWSPNGNSDITTYELSISEDQNFVFDISTPIPFANAYKSTSAVLSNLTPGTQYWFRVRAMNGSNYVTAFDTTPPNHVSTVTVGSVANFVGTPLSATSIRWEWDPAVGATFYDVYEMFSSTNIVFIDSTTYNYFIQTDLSTNTSYGVAVIAKRDISPKSPVSGPAAYKDKVYTLAVQPLPGVPNVFTSVTTGTFTANWIANGNPEWTMYEMHLSTDNFITIVSSMSTNQTNFQFIYLMPNSKYYVRIRAYNGNGNQTNYVQLGSKYTRAQSPTKVSAVSVSLSGIKLQWDVGANPPYTIYEVRGTTDSTWTDAGAIKKYVSFDSQYKSNSISINGLFTSTTYYFDVAAQNKEGYSTAKTQCVPPEVFTMAGPNGAPAGSIAGTSDPSKTITISGTLPSGRPVSLDIPAGSFPKNATAIAISSSNTNYCSSVGIPQLEVAVYSEGGSQPYTPITVKIYYFGGSEANIINNNAKNLVIARYNPVSGQCLPMETRIDQGNRIITAILNHLSIFQLMLKESSDNLNNVKVYPNPLFINRAEQSRVAIEDIPQDSKVKIFTLSGEKVWEGTVVSPYTIYWDGKNKYGEYVASGIYLCLIESSAGKKIVKIAVER